MRRTARAGQRPRGGWGVFTRRYAGRGSLDWALTQLGRLPSSERFQEPRAAAASVICGMTANHVDTGVAEGVLVLVSVSRRPGGGAPYGETAIDEGVCHDS